MVISMENKDILVDVLDLIDRLDAFVKLYKIQVIAETLGKVSQDFKDSHTEIPWKNIKGMRNQLSHNYGQNNYRLIWSTYKEKLPELREQLVAILDDEYGFENEMF